MKDIQVFYQGHMHVGKVILFKSEYLEVELAEEVDIIAGNYVTCYDHKRKFEMRALRVDGPTIALFPSESDIFLVEPSTEIKVQEKRVFTRFNTNMEAVIRSKNDSYRITIVDISRSGIRFISTEDSIPTDCLYHSVIYCGEIRVFPEIYVKYSRTEENVPSYGAQIYKIDQDDLFLLRYFIVSQQLNL